MGRAFEKRKTTIFARADRMSKLFSRIGKDITIAVKAGGPSPDTNPSLRRVLQNARAQNMHKDRIEAAIKNSGVGVEQSLAAFRWGRMAVIDRAFVQAEIAKYAPKAAQAELTAGTRAIVDAVGAQGETRRDGIGHGEERGFRG